MPYITPEARTTVFNTGQVKTPGELNYLLTIALNEYLEQNGVNYTNINTVIGVLECAKLELYRRVVGSYEDQKCHDNGDVYTCIS